MSYGEDAYGGLSYGEAEGPLFIPALHRFAFFDTPPHDHNLDGHHLRRDGVSEDLFPKFLFPYRYLQGKFPPLDQIQGRSFRRIARPPSWVEFAQTYQQGFRIANDSLAVFELFVGIDQSPDFTATGQPVATSLTLPFSFSPPLPPTGGTTTFHLVVRKRNAYDLQSFNVYERFLTIDSSGAEVLGPITPPLDVRVFDVKTGELRVIAKYISSEDTNPAETWEIYIKEGSDPVPGTDTPVFSGAMVFLGVESIVNEVIAGFTPGAVAHVIVTALRTSDSGRGNAAVVLFTVALSLDLTDGFLFGGSTFEQR